MPNLIRAAVVTACALLLSVTASAAGSFISGAGSSAAKYVYQAWGTRFAQATGIALAYEPVGSSEGIRRIVARTVQFGASDVAPDAATLEKESLVLVPTVVTGAVPVINLPELGAVELRLDGPTLASIFSGDITQWSDPAIARLNPGITLPRASIRPVARGDGSGTTYNFTDYLSKASTDWRTRFGTGKHIDWVDSVATAKGSSGVVQLLGATPGGITYVDYSYVLKHHLSAVSMRNRAGRFVAATQAAFRGALMNSPWQSAGDFSHTLTDMAGTESWPITMGTFVLLPRQIDDPDAGRHLVSFFLWAFMHGDALAVDADFVRLPDPVQAKAYKALSSIRDSAGNLLAYDALSK